METTGIDLSAEPRGTAVASILWSSTSAELVALDRGVGDDQLKSVIEEADGKVGVDCPLGWPVAFVELMSSHASGRAAVPTDRRGRWRRPYTLRATDVHVHERTGLTPLSVSADRIGHTAIRLAALLADIGPGHTGARDGSGLVSEVYPAAALKIWELPHRGYKGKDNRRRLSQLVDALQDCAAWLNLGPFESTCRESDDCFDAVICALVARWVLTEQTVQPIDRDLANIEGWVHLPTSQLRDLA